MPNRLSIEVLKHSDTDYRLIFKDGKLIIRKRFDSAIAMKAFLFARLDLANVTFN
jgi:hypothetical protein